VEVTGKREEEQIHMYQKRYEKDFEGEKVIQ
jgi:hypothetical protein